MTAGSNTFQHVRHSSRGKGSDFGAIIEKDFPSSGRDSSLHLYIPCDYRDDQLEKRFIS
jgi:hypothetical protein